MSADDLLLAAEAHLTARRLHQAQQAFNEAEACGADPGRCRAGRWMAAMLLGEFAAAWRENDAIRSLAKPDPHRFWQGEDLRDRDVIIRCLHGLGDAVQMLRYAPQLQSRARSVTFEVPPKLLSLAPCFAGVTKAITWGHDAPAIPLPWQVQVEVMELPFLFRTTLAHLPLATNYLLLSPEQEGTVAHTPKTKPRVGLVWSSGEWDPERSIPLALLEPLLSINFVEWWNLQGGPAATKLNLRQPPPETVHTLAATIRTMDLVITVDTLAAHLAGALGIPVLLLLQSAADWRWMIDRHDSPWYPSMRLFRQPAPGDWPGVVLAVRTALVALYG